MIPEVLPFFDASLVLFFCHGIQFLVRILDDGWHILKSLSFLGAFQSVERKKVIFLPNLVRTVSGEPVECCAWLKILVWRVLNVPEHHRDVTSTNLTPIFEAGFIEPCLFGVSERPNKTTDSLSAIVE